MTTIESSTVTEFAEVNPSVDLRGLSDGDRVSFIPMSDVTDSGEWINRQERSLGDVRGGYTSFREGDVLFAKITPCMENGKGAHAVGLTNGIGFGSTEFQVLRARDSNSARFLFHLLQAPWTRTRAIAFMGGSAGQQRVSSDFFSHFRIKYFQSDEQTRIAKVLDTVDEAIAKTDAVIAKLRQVRVGLLHNLLTRGLDKNGELRDPLVHPEQFQDSPIGCVPKEWEILRLTNKASVLGGKRLPGGHFYSELPTGFRYLRVLDFFEREIDFEKLVYLTSETFAALSRYEIKDGDLYISIAGSLGFSGVLRKPIPDRIVLTENAARIEVRSGFIPEYLSSQINGPFVRPQIRAKKGIGAGVPKLALHRIESLMVPMPLGEEQDEVVRAISEFEKIIQSENMQVEKLRLIRAGIMTDLLTGRVSVPEGII